MHSLMQVQRRVRLAPSGELAGQFGTLRPQTVDEQILQLPVAYGGEDRPGGEDRRGTREEVTQTLVKQFGERVFGDDA